MANRFLRKRNLPQHQVEQHVEWLYAFDVHCNSWFPLFLELYGELSAGPRRCWCATVGVVIMLLLFAACFKSRSSISPRSVCPVVHVCSRVALAAWVYRSSRTNGAWWAAMQPSAPVFHGPNPTPLLPPSPSQNHVTRTVLQFLLTPLLLLHAWLPSALSCVLYAVAFSHYHYLNFLGYSALPFLEQTEALLWPVGAICIALPLALLLRFNPSRFVLSMYFS